MQQQNLNLSAKSQKIQHMFDKISGKYDFLNRLLSFRQDVRWRKALLSKVPAVTTQDGVLYDVACGTGDVILSCCLGRTDYTHAIGFDISSGMLNHAAENCAKKTSFLKDKTIEFTLASAEKIPAQSNSADCVTIAFGLRNVDNRNTALAEFLRVLKPGGRLLVLEFFPAKSSLFQTLFHFYFKKVLPTIGGLISDKDAYSYLPHSVESMPPPHEFKTTLESIGFTQVESQSWLSGSTVLFSCTKP